MLVDFVLGQPLHRNNVEPTLIVHVQMRSEANAIHLRQMFVHLLWHLPMQCAINDSIAIMEAKVIRRTELQHNVVRYTIDRSVHTGTNFGISGRQILPDIIVVFEHPKALHNVRGVRMDRTFCVANFQLCSNGLGLYGNRRRRT